MTPDERDLVTQLFDRLAALEDAPRDPEAERMLKDGLREAPNAPYALVQTVLVQDEALKRADARIRELEEAAGAAPAPQGSSFLGGMRDALLGRRETRGSVPSVPPGEAGQQMSPAWNTGVQSVPAAGAPAPIGQGGSFLGTAAATAAGMVGGSLLLGGIRSMMGGHGGFGIGPAAVAGTSPWSSGDAAGGELSRQAGLDDIGRGRSGSDEPGAGQGLFGATHDDAEQDQDSDETDDSNDSDDDNDVDGDDGGGEE